MPLAISIRKQQDKSGFLHCQRSDGSATFQHQPTHVALHFVYHDLTHYAVETVLTDLVGFFSLIEAGWNIEDTTGKGEKGPLPESAIKIEQIVGLFDLERTTPTGWPLHQFNEFAPRNLTQTEFNQIKTTQQELFQKWESTGIDKTLNLTFTSAK